MKYLSIILSLIIFLFTSCQEKEVTYKQFSANDKSYTVHIPSDFSLENSIGNSMAFVKSNSNSKSDFSTILIYETDNGLSQFEQSLTTYPKFEFSSESTCNYLKIFSKQRRQSTVFFMRKEL